MASDIIAFIASDLEVLRVKKDRVEYSVAAGITIMMHKLSVLRTFLLCSTVLANNAQLRTENSNDNIHDRVRPRSQKTKTKRNRKRKRMKKNRRSLLIRFEDVFWRVYGNDQNPDLESFKEEMDKWYTSLSDYLQRYSTSPMANQVEDIANSVVENLENFLTFHRSSSYVEFLVELIQELKGSITFMTNFIGFTTLLGADSAENREFEDFLTLIESLAISASHFTLHLFSASYGYHDKVFSEVVGNSTTNLTYDGMKSMITALLLSVKPADNPRLHETNTRVLETLKNSRELHVRNLNIKDCIALLLSTLWEILQLDTASVLSFKDQLGALYEELRCLRTLNLYKKHPFDVSCKIKEITRAALFDAGIIIFSLYQKDVQIEDGLRDFVKHIKVVRRNVGNKEVQTSKFYFPKTTVLGFLDFLLEYLMEVKCSKVESDIQIFVRKIQENIEFLRSLVRMLVELENQQNDLHQSLWSLVVEVSYKIEFFIDQMLLGEMLYRFSTPFQSITEDITKIKSVSKKILNAREQEIKVHEITSVSTDQVPPPIFSPLTDEVVGFFTERSSVINRLVRGSNKLQAVPIVGMPGSGKTTLATKIYNDPSIRYHFHVKAWCSISQVLNRRKVLLELLNQIQPGVSPTMNEDDLSQELWRSLRRCRYLIFLDDIWDIQAFDLLKGSFPDDSTRSRILLTTRHGDVVPEDLLDDKPLLLTQLSDTESFELLKVKLTVVGEDWPPALHEFGMKIAGYCKGLPLTIVILAGVLKSTKQEVWNEVLESLRSGIISSTDQCIKTLDLSYKHLPDHLKPCFLYFGMFPEDHVVSVKKLIWQWIAEGFVRKSESRSLEKVAVNYLDDLISRSLVMNVKRESVSGVKACRVHDLLRDFCLRKANDENFLHLVKGHKELLCFHDPGNLRRLCIYSTQKDFKDSKLYSPRLRSLLLYSSRYEDKAVDMSFICRIFKLLRVLDIERVYYKDFPTEIGFLVQLRCLAISCISNVATSIGELSNLETLIIRNQGGMSNVKMPCTFWNLKKLRHLYSTGGHIELSTDDLHISSDMLALETLSTIEGENWEILKKQLSKFPNIRELKCSGRNIVDFSFMSQLESLSVKLLRNEEFNFPYNIKKLTLCDCKLSSKSYSKIAELPNLEVLKLEDIRTFGKIWHVEEGEFLKLKLLKLISLDIVQWTASDDQFPNLEKLVLENCNKLEKIPECLENVATLEMIEVVNCSDRIASLAKKVEDCQKDMGDSSLRINVVSTLKNYPWRLKKISPFH